MANTKRPFDRNFVLRTTYQHMLTSIDFSIRKTIERIPEFEGNREKSQEVMMSLSDLHAMKRDVEKTIASLEDK